MFAPMCPQAHIIRRSRHHWAPANIICRRQTSFKKRTFVTRQKFVFLPEGEIYELNFALVCNCVRRRFELYSLRATNACGVWRFALCCDYVATLAGATFAASLESELSDSAMLGYLRPACCASCGTIGNLSFSANAKKAPIGCLCVGGEGEI